MVQQRDAVKWVSAGAALKNSPSQIIGWNYELREEITGPLIDQKELDTFALS